MSTAISDHRQDHLEVRLTSWISGLNQLMVMTRGTSAGQNGHLLLAWQFKLKFLVI